MKKILEKLFDHNYLEYEESKKVLKEISSKNTITVKLHRS